MGVFRLLRRGEGIFTFQLTANDGHVLLTGGEYQSIETAHASIVMLRANAPHDSHYTRFTRPNGLMLFSLRTADDILLGTSGVFETEDEREAEITRCKLEASEASLDDLT